MTSKIVVNTIEGDVGVSSVTFNDTIYGNLEGNVTGNVNSTGISTFSVIAGVSTIGVGQTIHANSVGVGTNLSDVNDLNYPITFNTGTYSNQERKPGIVWRSDNSSPTLPKNAIFTREHNGGSELHFATSSNYVSGITTSAYIDEYGRFVSTEATYAAMYAPGSQTRSTSGGWVKITLDSGRSGNISADTANSKITILDPGIYLTIGEIQWSASDAGGAWTALIGIWKNGSQVVSHGYLHEGYNSGYSNTITISYTNFLDVGDDVELYWQQNTSSTNTFNSNTFLSVQKIV